MPQTLEAWQSQRQFRNNDVIQRVAGVRSGPYMEAVGNVFTLENSQLISISHSTKWIALHSIP